MYQDWSRLEVEVVVADYLDMLNKELQKKPYNKAEHNRNLRTKISRSHGSIERKHQNISAILIELGYPYIDGYKPFRNYQSMLRRVVEEHLEGTSAIDSIVEKAVEDQETAIPSITDLLAIQVDAPAFDERERRGFYSSEHSSRRLKRRNYLEIEARNHSLGLVGEKIVLEFEHQRLWQAGRKSLANRIEHVAQTKGDFMGYDIHSFETDGKDRLIEVKTTRFGASTPFFASSNEVGTSEELGDRYKLYRLFNLRDEPKLFVLSGSLKTNCHLDPTAFSALPRSTENA